MCPLQYDILDRYGEITRFTWGGLWRLFATAFRTGILRVPIAAAEASLEMKLSGSGEVEEIKERVGLVAEFRGERVRNKRIARDYLLLFTQRRPPGTDYVEWDETIFRGEHWACAHGCTMSSGGPSDRA